jgi:hypothetical protein
MTNNAFIKYVASTEGSLPRLLLTNSIVQDFDTLQSFKGGGKFPTFYQTRKCTTVLTNSSPFDFVLSQFNPIQMLKSNTFHLAYV